LEIFDVEKKAPAELNEACRKDFFNQRPWAAFMRNPGPAARGRNKEVFRSPPMLSTGSSGAA
jgi:hypothetical protein